MTIKTSSIINPGSYYGGVAPAVSALGTLFAIDIRGTDGLRFFYNGVDSTVIVKYFKDTTLGWSINTEGNVYSTNELTLTGLHRIKIFVFKNDPLKKIGFSYALSPAVPSETSFNGTSNTRFPFYVKNPGDITEPRVSASETSTSRRILYAFLFIGGGVILTAIIGLLMYWYVFKSLY